MLIRERGNETNTEIFLQAHNKYLKKHVKIESGIIMTTITKATQRII
jgi:hypothetical protein